MMRRMIKKGLSLLMACVILAGPCIPTVAEGQTVYIKTPQDLMNMAKECRLDTASRGKTYVLSADIGMEATGFAQIPVFRGTFDGRGYTISGFVVRQNIAPAGLFGIIETDGVVKNLKLKGNVIPSGDSSTIGGFCGINRGLIENCEFNGTVSGKEEIGGIVGVNETAGIVREATTKGKVIGQKMSGGIVGNNHGLVDNCKSLCLVNLDSTDPTINIDEIESGMQAITFYDTEVEKIYSAIEDAGGIAGFSDGIVTNCTNEGDVGYSHIGYNIGGIVGRNQGFIYGCDNYGVINGRREVGGIAGQAEPFVAYRPTADNVGNIHNELRVLNNLVDKATRDADSASAQASARLSNINGLITNANDNLKDLSDAISTAVDDNLAEVNRGGDIAKSVSDRLSSITQKLPDINRKITEALDQTTKGMDKAKDAGAIAAKAMDDFSLAADDLSKAFDILEDGSQYISDGAQKISDAITVDSLNVEHIDWDMVKEGTDLISKGLDIINDGNDGSGNGAYHYLSSASDHIRDGSAKLRDAAKDMDEAFGFFEKATDILKDASKDVTGVLEEVSSLAEFLSNTDPLKFSYIKTKTDQAGSSLHSNINSLSREVEALNKESKSSSDVLMADIRAINDQFYVVMSLLLDEIGDLENTSFNTRVEDISDEDINNSTDGKIQLCKNNGKIFGDINIGGIAGSMGIFNEQNPEDDNSSINDIVRARYKLKAILQDCTNYGEITSKKDNVGAVCGLSSLGVITGCKGFGSAISEDGDYVGGISGGNSTTIRNSYGKCSISGEKYVGGIVGFNSTKDNGSGSITNCVAAINILAHKQYSGAICGYDEGEIRNNYFFGDYTGINNASYFGKAEPVSFEELVAIENIPEEFKRFKVSFVADEKVIKEIDLDYLDGFDETEFPKIPALEGQYGKWDRGSIEKIDFDRVVTAEYFPYVTAIAGKFEDDESKFLAIGKFNDASTLEVSPGLESSDVNALKLPAELFALTRPKEVWEISATDLEGDDVYLRYHLDEIKAKSLRFYVKTGDAWQKAGSKEVGSYMEFSVPSGTHQIAVATSTSFAIIFMIVLILAVLACLLWFLRKKITLILGRKK